MQKIVDKTIFVDNAKIHRDNCKNKYLKLKNLNSESGDEEEKKYDFR